MEAIDTLDPMDRLVALRGVPLFAELATEDLESISAVTSLRRFEPGEVVFAQGDPGEEMLVVVAGGAEVSRRDGDGRRPIATVGAGAVVGELAILRRHTRSADVIAGDEGLMGIVIDAGTFERMIEERPRIAFSLLATMADRLAETSLLQH